MPRIREKYYFKTKEKAELVKREYTFYGIKCTVKKLGPRSYVVQVY